MVERASGSGHDRLDDLAIRWQRCGCPKSPFDAGRSPGEFLLFRDVVRAEMVATNPEAKPRLIALATLLHLAVADFLDLLWRIPREEKPLEKEKVWCLDPLSGPPFLGWRRGPQWRRQTPPNFRFVMDLPCVVALWMPDLGISPPDDSRERLRTRH
jgi:hypothetical protein